MSRRRSAGTMVLVDYGRDSILSEHEAGEDDYVVMSKDFAIRRWADVLRDFPDELDHQYDGVLVGVVSVTQPISLDAILERAESMWREWRRGHPDYAGDTSLGADNDLMKQADDADMDERDRITSAVIPAERHTLLMLALDDRVWDEKSLDQEETPGECILQAVEQRIWKLTDEIDDGRKIAQVEDQLQDYLRRNPPAPLYREAVR